MKILNDALPASKPIPVAETTASDESEKPDSNPFLDPKVAAHYRDVYEKAQYECRHVFDPTLEWSEDEERRIVRKLDWHVCLWACIMFFALQVDRKNLGQAVSADMLQQLNLTTNDYNYGPLMIALSRVETGVDNAREHDLLGFIPAC